MIIIMIMIIVIVIIIIIKHLSSCYCTRKSLFQPCILPGHYG